jgi:tetratricopeptide (TPR) repeat protein
MFREYGPTIGIMVFCFVVLVFVAETFRDLTPFDGVEQILREKPPDYFSWGNTHLENKEYDQAIADYTEAIRLNPNDARPYERLAWVLATTPKDEVRKGTEAVKYASKACELTEWKNPDYLATLATACAELGYFKEAIQWQIKALESPEMDTDKVEDHRQRLKLFEEGKPYREKS